MIRSPYLRDRIAELPLFRNRDRLLPMSPTARCSRSTATMLPRRDPAQQESRGLPLFLAAMPPIGCLEVIHDDSIPEGIVEIDGTRIALTELVVAVKSVG